MTLIELKVFMEVARYKGITSAGQSLGMAKSAISKHLSSLEENLELKLFSRSSRRVELTVEGQRLLPQVLSLLAESERLKENARNEANNIAGNIRIAASPEFGGLAARHLFPLINRSYPDLKLLMDLGYQMTDLQDPSIDIAFRVGEVFDDRIVAHPVGTFRRILVTNPCYFKSISLQSPDDLRNVNCFVFSDRDTEKNWTLQHSLKASTIVEVDISGNSGIKGFTALLELARYADGIAWIPDFMAYEALSRHEIVRCLPDWASTPTQVYVAYRYGATRVARIKSVVEVARTELPKILNHLPTLAAIPQV